jgi:hypothetical protein
MGLVVSLYHSPALEFDVLVETQNDIYTSPLN